MLIVTVPNPAIGLFCPGDNQRGTVVSMEVGISSSSRINWKQYSSFVTYVT